MNNNIPVKNYVQPLPSHGSDIFSCTCPNCKAKSGGATSYNKERINSKNSNDGDWYIRTHHTVCHKCLKPFNTVFDGIEVVKRFNVQSCGVILEVYSDLNYCFQLIKTLKDDIYMLNFDEAIQNPSSMWNPIFKSLTNNSLIPFRGEIHVPITLNRDEAEEILKYYETAFKYCKPNFDCSDRYQSRCPHCGKVIKGAKQIKALRFDYDYTREHRLSIIARYREATCSCGATVLTRYLNNDVFEYWPGGNRVDFITQKLADGTVFKVLKSDSDEYFVHKYNEKKKLDTGTIYSIEENELKKAIDDEDLRNVCMVQLPITSMGVYNRSKVYIFRTSSDGAIIACGHKKLPDIFSSEKKNSIRFCELVDQYCGGCHSRDT